MSGAKHTPGPWEMDGIAVADASHKTVCIMGEIDGFESGYVECHNYRANGLLIAAAPTMLDALRSILSNAGGRCTAEQWQAGLQAIAKAEGRS